LYLICNKKTNRFKPKISKNAIEFYAPDAQKLIKQGREMYCWKYCVYATC